MSRYDRHDLENALEELLSAKDLLVRREIDWSTCRTNFDRKEFEKAREHYNELLESFLQKIRRD